MPDDFDIRLPGHSEVAARPLADLRPPVHEPDTDEEPRRRVFSSLTMRILAVNLTAPVLLVLLLLFVDRYAETLLATELRALATRGSMIAASISDSAVVVDTEASDFGFTPSGTQRTIDADSALPLIRGLATRAGLRARLFDRNGNLLVDSHLFGGEVQVMDLAPMEPKESFVSRQFRLAYNATIGRFSYERRLPLYHEPEQGQAGKLPEVRHALETGEDDAAAHLRDDGQKILIAAIPVQWLKNMVGVVLVDQDASAVDERLFDVRRWILGMFFWVLVLTALTSLYLAGTIARPIRRLARAAERVRLSKQRQHTIPDLTGRSDEIGELSAALREMTESLWARMDAIERFAADVAHEIKNPLTSLRSAVETVSRIKDPEAQKRLMAIIVEDVSRLDRLISDISDASRLDAELSRAETAPVTLKRLLSALAELQNANDAPDAPRVEIDASAGDEYQVPGLEGRVGQVFRNLIGNAVSFSPPGGTICVRLARDGSRVRVSVEDQGPGIPPGKERAIFERFYSERPEGEKFGTHSGLGLSISKQIVEAHRGTIFAENIHDTDDHVRGARFVVRLPAV